MKITVQMTNPEAGVLEIGFYRGETLLHNVFYDIEGLPDTELQVLKAEAIAKFGACFPDIPAKDIMQGFAAVDPQMYKLYKETFPQGGKRDGAGRKKLPPETKRNKHNIYCTAEELCKVRKFLRNLRNELNLDIKR